MGESMWTSKDIIQYFIKFNASCKSIKKMQIHVSNKKIHLDIFSLQLVSNLMSGKTSVTGDFGVFLCATQHLDVIGNMPKAGMRFVQRLIKNFQDRF